MKNSGKRFIAGLCSAALCASMLSVSAFAAQDGFKEYEATSDNVKLIGRTYRYNDETTWLTYSASGVEFKCTGSKVRFNLHQEGDPTRVAVYVNGKAVKIGYVKANAKKPVIDVDLEDGENTVKLIKLSEAANSILAIDSIEVDGDAPVPTATKAHSIEFIGDSITCGYGVDGSLKEQFSTKNENAAKTYAYLTAANLDADYSFVSTSGSGIISGYTSGSKKNTLNLTPDVYEKLCYTWSWIDGVHPQEYDWDFSEFQPEAVVINLGTNDNSYTKGDAEKCAEYVEGYVAFLKQVRANNPDSSIVCTLGIMGQELYPYIEEAVEAYKTETGDTNIYTFEFNNQNAADNGYGSDYHPSEQSHLEASYELTAALSDMLGWEETGSAETGMAGYDKANDLVFENDPNEEDSSSQSSSDVSSETSSSENSSETSSKTDDSSSSAASSSKASSSSKAASSGTTTNPATGAATAGLAAAAVIGASIVITRKKK